tara:strand:+ start:1410 stop:1535 length:126 start_codon:yes stop_codon:yes gene_type:complete
VKVKGIMIRLGREINELKKKERRGKRTIAMQNALKTEREEK